MKKSVIVGAAVLALGGATFAGMSIADNKVEALYNQSQIGILHNFKTTNMDLGFKGGKVDWTADVMLDPCQPELKFTLEGSDTVSKGLTGYTIQTQLTPKVYDENLMLFLNQLPKLTVDTKVNWLGGGSTKFLYPKHDIKEGDARLNWSDFEGGFEFNNDNDEFKARDLNFDLQNASFDIDQFHANLVDLEYKSDLQMGAVVDSGDAEFSIESISINDSQDDHTFTINNMTMLLNQVVNSESIDFGQEITIDGINVAFSGTNIDLKDAKLGFEIKDLDRSAVDSIVETVNKSSEQCVPQNQLVSELSSSVLALVQQGMTIESKGNQFKLGNGTATADVNVLIPKFEYASLEQSIALLPEKADYEIDITFNKPLIKSISELGEGSNGLISSSTDENWKTAIEMTGATVEGDRAIIHLSN